MVLEDKIIKTCALRVYARHLATCEQSPIIKATRERVLQMLGEHSDVETFK